MVIEKMSLAKGGIYRDQMLKTHSEVTSKIAKYVAELRDFDSEHAQLLFLASYYHDMGKGILEKYMGNHKIQFERCLDELEKVRPDIDIETRQIVAHLILRHHYTSKGYIKTRRNLRPNRDQYRCLAKNAEVLRSFGICRSG